MAQTKRKRSTKHRGNAAGQIEARGRTGKPSANTKDSVKGKGKGSPKGKDAKAQAAADRRNKVPTWQAAFIRALVAAVAVAAISMFEFHYTIAKIGAYLPIVVAIYTPLGYYTDTFLYRRRNRSKAP